MDVMNDSRAENEGDKARVNGGLPWGENTCCLEHLPRDKQTREGNLSRDGMAGARSRGSESRLN